MEKDRASRLCNQQRLRELKGTRIGIDVVSSHDPLEFELLAKHPLRIPAISAAFIHRCASSCGRRPAASRCGSWSIERRSWPDRDQR